MTGSPKNVVHLTNSDVSAGRTKHVTLEELYKLQQLTDGAAGTVTVNEIVFSTGAKLKVSEDGTSLVFVPSGS